LTSKKLHILPVYYKENIESQSKRAKDKNNNHI
jgi:hypothetical protein